MPDRAAAEDEVRAGGEVMQFDVQVRQSLPDRLHRGRGGGPVDVAVGEPHTVLPISGRVHARFGRGQVLPVERIEETPIDRRSLGGCARAACRLLAAHAHSLPRSGPIRHPRTRSAVIERSDFAADSAVVPIVLPRRVGLSAS